MDVRRFICLIAALFLAPSLAFAEETLTPQQILKDAKQLEFLLRKYHPNLHAHRSIQQLNILWKTAKSDLPEKPVFLDAVTLFQKQLAAACDEHTLVRKTRRWQIGKNWLSGYFPAGLVVEDKKLYLDDTDFGRASKQILRINDRSNEAIVSFLKSILSADACVQADPLFSHHSVDPLLTAHLLTYFLGTNSTFDIEYVSPHSDTVERLTLDAVPIGEIRRRLKVRSLFGRSAILNLIGLETSPKDWEFAASIATKMFVRTSTQPSVHYVYVNRFDGKEAQAVAIDREMRLLVDANPDNVIIDLTDNPGGSFANSQRFLSHFLKTANRTSATMRARRTNMKLDEEFVWLRRVDPNNFAKFIKQFRRGKRRSGQFVLTETPRSFGNRSYSGNLVVLVSPKTGSAATTVATILKRKAGATIVGDIGNASMKTTCSSAPGAFPLGETHVQIMIPMDCRDRHRDARTRGNLLKPDVQVDLSAQDSRRTNAAILSAAIDALDLPKIPPVATRRKDTERKRTTPSISSATSTKRTRELENFQSGRKTVAVKLEGHPRDHKKAWIGASLARIQNVNLLIENIDSEYLYYITKVYAGSPADKVGLRSGDVILSIGGKPAAEPGVLMDYIGRQKPGFFVPTEVGRRFSSVTELIDKLTDNLNTPQLEAQSAFILGSLYASGDFGETKRTEAIPLLKRASDKGMGRAAVALGNLYGGLTSREFFAGFTPLVLRDRDLSVTYFERAAVLGDTGAMLRLARIHNDPDSGYSDPERAAWYLLHAYQNGNRAAQRALAGNRRTTWSGLTAKALNSLLKGAGLYRGEPHKVIDEQTLKALAQLTDANVSLPSLPALEGRPAKDNSG